MDLKKKAILIAIIAVLLFSVVSYTQSFFESSGIAVYYDGALVKNSVILNKEDEIELPSGIVEESFYAKGNSPLVKFEVVKKGEIENNIGKEITVYFKNKEIKGKLLDYKDGKAYIEVNDGIAVVYPEGFIIKDAKSTLKAKLYFKDNPGETLISYITQKLTWNANHKIFLGKDKLKIESYAVITNKDNKKYEGDVKLYTKSMLGSYYVQPPIYYKTATIEESSPPKIEEKQTTLEFPLGKLEINPKSTVNTLLGGGETDYKRKSSLSFYYRYSGKKKASDSLIFKAPYALAKGDVYVYSDYFEKKVSMDNKAKGEEVILSLGEDLFIEGELSLKNQEYKRDGNKITREDTEVLLRVKNYGDNEKKVELNIEMPSYLKWEVLSSSENYKKENNKIKYGLSLKGGEEKEINLKVRINYD